SEDRHSHIVCRRLEGHLDRHTDVDLACIGVSQVGEDTDTLIQIDQHGDHGIAEGWVLRMMEYRVAVDDACPCQVDDLPLDRVAGWAHWSWRMSQLATVPASLRDQTGLPRRLPEGVVVLGQDRCRPLHTRARCHGAARMTVVP